MKIRATLLIIATASLFALLGCSEKLFENTNEGSKLVINVDGILGVESTAAASASQESKRLSTGISRASSATSKTGKGFKANFSNTQEPIGFPDYDSKQPSFAPGTEASIPTISRSSTQPMQKGYTYRVLLYNKTTGELWKTIEATAGKSVSLDPEIGETYQWYAYSHNDSDEIPVPADLVNPSIITSIDRDLMYASGEVSISSTSTGQRYTIGILFEHKVTQVHIKIDATSLASYARIDNLNATFDNTNYIKRGVFDIKGNQVDQIEVVSTETIFNSPSPTNIWEKSYYTVDSEELSSYKIIVNDLPVQFVDVKEEISKRNLATYSGEANKPTFTATFVAPYIGQRLSTVAGLSYELPPMRILHISNNASYGYALEQGPSWDFLNAKENFGSLPGSVIQIGSWANGQGGWAGGNQTDNKTENWIRFAATSSGDNLIVNRLNRTNNANRPDIVIIGYNVTTIRPAVATAINNYLNDNGVVIMMLQGANNSNTITFFNNLFGVSNIGMSAEGSGGAMYPIEGYDPNDPILNGRFGDVRGRHWGEDAGTTLGITNLPLSQVTVYSRGQAINREATDNRVTMFRHNTKNFFYIGDGGFVSYNGGTSSIICPFNYDPITKRPLPKPYGNAGNGYTTNSREAYNSIIIANVMSWAARKAEFEGIRDWNTGTLTLD